MLYSHYAVIKKNEIMLLAAAWMNMEITILNEVSLSEKDKYHRISLICKIKKKKKLIYKTETLTDLENKLIVTSSKELGRDRL